MGTWIKDNAEQYTFLANEMSRTGQIIGQVPYRYSKEEGSKRVFAKCLRCKTVQVFDFQQWAHTLAAFVSKAGQQFGYYRETPDGLQALATYRQACAEGQIRCACGGRLEVAELKATYNEAKPCNARCMGATGPACDCACAGINHGGRHVAVSA